MGDKTRAFSNGCNAAHRMSRMATATDVQIACDELSDRELTWARMVMDSMYDGAVRARREAESLETKLMVFGAAIDEVLRRRGVLSGGDDDADG